MGKPKKSHSKKKYSYSKNKRRQWKRMQKLPAIECEQIKNAWSDKKSVKRNIEGMGLAYDSNQTLKIPNPKDLLGRTVEDMEVQEIKTTKPKKKTKVIEELENEANAPQDPSLELSEPSVRYCIYMIEKHGEDYKAMALDAKNHYQDTPKQIRKKINRFKTVKEQYNAYLRAKEAGTLDIDLS